MAQGVSGAQTLVLFGAMVLVTCWFTNLVLRATDVLYRPRLRKWVGDSRLENGEEDSCPLGAGRWGVRGSSGKSATKERDLSKLYSDEYLKELERELMLLKAMRASRVPEKRRKKGEMDKGAEEKDTEQVMDIKTLQQGRGFLLRQREKWSPDLQQQGKPPTRLSCELFPDSESEECTAGHEREVGEEKSAVNNNYFCPKTSYLAIMTTRPPSVENATQE